MKLNLNQIEDFEDEEFLAVERLERKPSFRGENYRKEKNDSIRRKRKQKEQERQRMMEDSDHR